MDIMIERAISLRQVQCFFTLFVSIIKWCVLVANSVISSTSRAMWTSKATIKRWWMDSSLPFSWNIMCKIYFTCLHVHISELCIITKIPHAFQQRLSAEKTPTLCDALSSFSVLLLQWHLLQNEIPEMKEIIQPVSTSWKIISIGLCTFPLISLPWVSHYVFVIIQSWTSPAVLNPKMKLCWYERNDPVQLEWVKGLFMQEVILMLFALLPC